MSDTSPSSWRGAPRRLLQFSHATAARLAGPLTTVRLAGQATAARVAERATATTLARRAVQESGVTLIEVVVSAVMVGFIAIATFSGFNAVDKATAQERYHNQAALLVAQSQEQLRSDSAETLDTLQKTAHAFTQSVGGQTFTVSQSDNWVNDSAKTAGCSATSKESNTNQNGSYVEITSTVSWPQQIAAGRPAVTQTSYITPPDGSGLEIDVTNGGTPVQGVGGASAVANGLELTTSEAGCVIFGSIPATKVNVEVKKLGDVQENGSYRKVTKELQIVPNITTHYPVTLAPAGSVEAHFTYEGKPAEGDTFVVQNNNINELPDYELGSTILPENWEYEHTGEASGNYKAPVSTYGYKAYTYKNAEFYPNGDLFPFQAAWSVYAGDCPANEPAKFGASGASAQVQAGEQITVGVPTSYVKLEVFKPTSNTELETITSRSVKITNLSCKGYTPPNNSMGSLAIEHTQMTTTGVSGGHLSDPYQPFGKFKLCLYASSLGKSYWAEYTNEGSTPTTLKLYLKESSPGYTNGSQKVEIANGNKC